MTLPHAELTHAIIGAAIEVHCRLGPGFLESIYAKALAVELERRGLPFRRELEVPVRYRGVPVGLHRLDLLVQDAIVVELKTVVKLEPAHFAVVRSYLRATGLEHGLILNFAAPTLEVRRVSVAAPWSRAPGPPAAP